MTNTPSLFSSSTAPAIDAVSVVPSDTVDLSPGVARALYVGVGGNIQITTASGTVIVFVAVVAGTILPIFIKRVWATGTTATNLVALY